MQSAPQPATDAPARRPLWRARARLALADAAATTSGRLALLGTMVVTVWLLTSAAAALTDAESSYGMALWSGLRHLFDPGSLGDDGTTAQRVVGVAQVFTGLIFLAGVAFTVLAEGVDRGLQRLSTAEPPVTTRDHLLVVGDGHVQAAFLAALAADPGDAVPVVVTLSPTAGSARRRRGHPLRILARTGEANDPGALADAGVRAARAIVVLGGSSSDPAVADLATLECAAILAELLADVPEPPPVALHAHRGADVEAVLPLLPATFDAVPGDRNVGAALALGVSLPRYPSLLTGAADGGDLSPYVVPAGDLAGAVFADALERCPRALPIGLLRDGTSLYAPAPDTLVRAGDGLIILAADRASARDRGAPVAPGPVAPLPLEPDAPAPGRVLVLGWSRAGDDLAGNLGTDAELTVVAELDAAPAGVGPDRLRRGDPNDADAIAAALAAADPDIVVVLGSANGGADAIGGHARAALAALKVAQLSARPDLAIVVEQFASEQARRLRDADPRIRVISSDELVARALLLSSNDRAALQAYRDLVRDPRVSLEAVRCGADEPVALRAACRALLDARAAPLMLLRDGSELDPFDPAAEMLQPGDGLLLVRRAASRT